MILKSKIKAFQILMQLVYILQHNKDHIIQQEIVTLCHKNKLNITTIILICLKLQNLKNQSIKKHYFYKSKLKNMDLKRGAFHYYRLKMKMELECFKMNPLKTVIL
jgi:hypothetical protein